MPRSLKLRFAIIAGLLLVAGWWLLPTIRLYSLSPAERQALAQRDPKRAQDLKEKAIKLGLDLQGGMHLVLEIDDSERALGPDEKRRAIDQILEVIRNRVNQFGVAEPVIQKTGEDRIIVELPGIEDEERAKSLVAQAAYLEFQLVRPSRESANLVRRLDGALLTARARRELPAAGDTLSLPPGEREGGIDVGGPGARARPDTGSAGRPPTGAGAPGRESEVPTAAQDTGAAVTAQDTGAAAPQRRDTAAAAGQAAPPGQVADTEPGQAPDTGQAGTLESLIRGDTGAAAPETAGRAGDRDPAPETFSTAIQLDPGGTGDLLVREDLVPEVKRWLSLPSVQAAIPPATEILWSSEERTFSDGETYQLLYVVDRKPLMTGESIASANAGFDTEFQNRPIVSLTMTPEGRRLFGRVTGAHVNERLAIVLDGVVRMAPNIQQRIAEGRAQITGFDSPEESNVIAIVLQAGALEAPIRIIEERTIGPSLGADSIQASRRAFLIGALAVVLFMVIYYRRSGALADLAMILNIVFLLAVLAAIDATLTLPGIAGVILTVGMAVDANVLILERVREELERGRTVRQAIELGYDRAFTTILDSNVTTLIGGVVLLQFGTGPVKGFGLTLCIGIVISMFTAIFVTRTLYDAYLRNRAVERLSI